MKRSAILLLMTLTILSCNDKAKNENDIDQQIDSTASKNTVTVAKPETQEQKWYDDLIADYVKNANNALIKSSLKNNEKVEWLLDRTEKSDSANYYIFNIGHDVSEQDGSELRFSSINWIYVDSLSKKIYEYDLPNDSLVIWKNKSNR